jgi:hypothetical protein
MPNGWARVDLVRKVRAGLLLDFSVHRGRRGKILGHWTVTFGGVHEIKITDLDGGGLAVYPSSHPAARQYVARLATLRWPRSGDTPEVLAALQQAHVEAVDDWIPFDRYLQINTPYNGTPFLPHFAPVSGNCFVCKGPDFLLRAYANALEATGQQVHLRLHGRPQRRTLRPQVLHFGSSYVVADCLTAEQQ